LERYFSRKLRIEDKIEETTSLLPQCAIFRQIASGLAHQPDRRWLSRATIEHIENEFIHAQGLSGLPTKIT
jgi:hypothetical protein